MSDLAISARYTQELLDFAAQCDDSVHKIEKYRRICLHLIDRLVQTTKECEHQLTVLGQFDESNSLADKLSGGGGGGSSDSSSSSKKASVQEMMSRGAHGGVGRMPDAGSGKVESNANLKKLPVDPILEVDELMKPLRIMYDSLVETGFELVADGLLGDIIRRVSVFGLSLVPLDIREESSKHTEAIDAITRHLGIGSYKEWSEDHKVTWLIGEIASVRPLFRVREIRTLGFEPSVVNTLETFHMASGVQPACLGAYVISQAQQASDVLAVMMLQQCFLMTPRNGNYMRVVPLFETLDDLTRASDVLDTLFRIPLYLGAIQGAQEVMVGYSDSAKDAGRLAACWAQYKSQEEMARVAGKHNVKLTFFHGKGGTVGRGG
jgi:phosphoenolpyruvate carboxylase